MEDVGIEKKVISKHNEGFPDWLDFTKMRQEGMDYLGELSGNLWTDHNVHDPGITILEMLCYALLDLGYRTSLPAKDLFTRDPKETGDDDNFFTPAQILGCNPLTILDYRRLLVDIKGVKNAWLTIADDISTDSICGVREQPGDIFLPAENQPEPCPQFLNGLYHVYIDVENFDERDEVKDRVKKALMAHRNLCEDFYDITVLCKQKIGACADIEIEADADAGSIFLQVVEKLRDFISPTPKFYSLKQLLEEKKRSIEEIFAGRAYNLTESYGFVDVEEFESIVLRKEIHLSDVYDAIFSVKGVKAIRNLRLQNCDGSHCYGTSSWIFKIFENYVPEFTMDCSGFHFTRNGVEMNVDPKKYKQYLDLNFSNSGKLAPRPTTELDLPLPVGVYHDDLANYFPLENDFPKVYGIAEGSLPSKVSDSRKAQSLQLRGYLLFFDHLLSGYLSQLKNLRHLFSFRGSEQTKHTYYINQLSNWPGLDKLLRFSLTEDPSSSFGNVQASLVNRKQLEQLIEPGKITDCDFQRNLEPYSFCSAAERDIAINQLIQDAADGNIDCYVVPTRNCWFFYLFSSSKQFALVGPDEYASEEAALKACQSILFIAASQNNYRSYITDDKERFSFYLTAGIAGYWSYLQTLVENNNSYLERRKLFLNHLLARFSETFTDYALLSYSFYQEQQLQQNEIGLIENFLTAYPELSSNRGKAYDYSLNGWNNTNVSGFEKKSAAYAGMETAMQKNLCHFEVGEFEAQSVVNLAWKNFELFKSENSFDSRVEAKEALQGLIVALQDSRNYTVSFSSLENNYSIEVKTGDLSFRSIKTFPVNEEAQQAVEQYSRLFSPLPLPADVQPSLFRHEVVIEKKFSNASWQKQNPLIDAEPNLKLQPAMLAGFPSKEEWSSVTEVTEDIVLRSNPDNPAELINVKAFDYYVNRIDVRNNTLIYQFTVSDLQKKFFFVCEQEFTDPEEADKALIRFLFLLRNSASYSKEQAASGVRYIKIISEKNTIATDRIEVSNEDEFNEAVRFILEYVNNQLYFAKIETVPVRWKYNFLLGLPGTSQFSFASSKEFESYDKAKEATTKIYKLSSKLTIIPGHGTLEIKDPKKPDDILASHSLPDTNNTAGIEEEARDLLTFKKTIAGISANPGAPEIEEMIIPDGISRLGNFGYRLVKKNSYHAWYYSPHVYKNKEVATQEIKAIHRDFNSGLQFLELYYGGENIREIKNSTTGISRFHFLIKSRMHAYAPGSELILFESAADYPSIDEAQVAFDEQYVSILTKATDHSNYGTMISFDENAAKSSKSITATPPLVFIPPETMKLFGYNHDHAAENLSMMASSYPVQCINKADPLFAYYFLCDAIPPEPTDPCGCVKEEKDVYIFKLQLQAKDPAAWISHEYFDTPKEALRQFYFFLILLQYKGNYHVGWNECHCTPRLYVREILAESSRRFATAAEAWGREGVEKFICASQTENAFFTYRNEKNCCFTFKVACANTGLVHPCTYDTPEKRDKAMEKLLRASRSLAEEFKKGNPINNWKNAIAEWHVLAKKKNRAASYCEDAVEGMKEITQYLWKKQDNLLSLSINEVVNENDREQIEKLKKLTTYFPIKRKRLDIPNTEVYKYFLDIKLPGFCEEDLKEADPCGCNSDDSDDGCSCCCTAWVSECCFDTCEEAIEHYQKLARCLAEPANYYPVFDCECGPYGIRFSCNCDEHDPRQPVNPNVAGFNVNEEQKTDCCNEVVAYNPQCYTSAVMVCDAVRRAKRLINAEGLHLVEHILLRPHCMDGDCNCIIPICDSESSCRFTWNLPGDDPCTKDQSYCFLPGADPYSFIATAVLPAWPERFRKKENRQLIEQLLYRETPAHILLRVLWLNPFDLCRFELLHYNWCKWLAGKPVCGDHNAPCELIDFLFKHTNPNTERPYPFECFECAECIPCLTTANPVDPCADVTRVEKDPNEYVNAINELFCWPLICPKFYKRGNDIQLLNREIAVEPVVEILLPVSEKTVHSEKDIDAERKMDERFYGYRIAVREIAERTGNANAGVAWQFINDPLSSFENYEQAVNAIVNNKKTGDEEKKLSTSEKRSLIEYLTWYYLDNAVWAATLETHKGDVKTLFDKLRKRDLLPDYKDWKGADIPAMKEDVPLHMIKKFFT